MADEVLRGVWGRVTGGEDVASTPGRPDETALPFGPPAAGAQEAIDWYLQHLEATEIPCVLILLGGPGSGKSALATRAVRDFDLVSPRTALAERLYEYQRGQTRLLLVNDATIGSDRFPVSPLCSELAESIGNGIHVIANVNRGILLEELESADRNPLGSAIVSWLQQADDDDPAPDDAATIKPGPSCDYLRQGILQVDAAPVANLIAVEMDTCSLFEARPSVRIGPHGLEADSYVVWRFSDRGALDLNASAGGALVTQLCGMLEPRHHLVDLLDPVAANIASLRSEQFRKGLLSVLRGAEIVGGSRFTYREVWGAVGLTILGHVPSQTGFEELDDWIIRSQPGEGTGTAVERFELVKRLARHRSWQALFDLQTAADQLASGPVDGLGPVAEATIRVDPAVDSNHAWSEPLAHAFGMADPAVQPLEWLAEHCDPALELGEVLQPFDVAVDRAYTDAYREADDSDRRKLTSWYGAYLTRLLGLASGSPAFRDEVQQWTLACYASPALPDRLAPSLRALLMINGVGGGSQKLPVFDARVAPITTGEDRRVLVRDVMENWALTTERVSDRLTLFLEARGTRKVRLDLDFPMIREALACEAGEKGFTEYASVAMPRLERFRAALLRPDVENDDPPVYHVWDADNPRIVYVGQPHA